MLQMPTDTQIDSIITALGCTSPQHYIHLAAWYLIMNGAAVTNTGSLTIWVLLLVLGHTFEYHSHAS
ncbi:hypothetical protein M405DRAFT_829839 [Rhizopogon salebrosus TDB-379]|nr:hypothetical protein M405DRAFT_829839 [Rhizopogon salebrosus TDB-379]